MARNNKIELYKSSASIVPLANSFSEDDIRSHIYTIRGVQVMLDRDIAVLYQVPTGRLNEAVKRNIERFPADFMFQLSDEETQKWKSQIAITNSIKMGLRHNLYAFTEQGICAASSKDGGNRVTTMPLVKEASIYHSLIDQAMQNDVLTLK